MTLLKTYRRKDFVKDILLVFIIVLTPLIIYIHLFVPETQLWETLLFTIESNYYKDIQSLIWTVSIKMAYIIAYSICLLYNLTLPTSDLV